jgi:hypothetical protein
VLRLLLDEHIAPAVARQVATRCPGLEITPLAQWHGGQFLGTPDAVWLPEAFRAGLTLVTYDRASITPLLRTLAEQGLDHGGVVLIDDRTIAQRDLGGIVRALYELWTSSGRGDWTNRVEFLRKSGR